MATEFVVFLRGAATGKDATGSVRVAYRRADIGRIREAATNDADQRAIVTVAGEDVRVDNLFEECLDLMGD